VIHSKVFDKVIDGREYQLIKVKELLLSFKKIGIEFDQKDKKYLNDLLVPILNDLVDIKVLERILGDLGIKEDIPVSTPQIDFSKLEGQTVRICNKIIRYMRAYDITDVSKLIQRDEIELFNVVSKTKEHVIQTIQVSKFKDILKSKDIIKHGDDIDEKFLEFLQVSPAHEDIIVI